MSNIHDHLYPLRTLACNLIKQIIFLGKACPIRGDASRRRFEGGGKVSKLFLFQPQFFQGDKQLFWKVMAKRSNKSVTSSLDTKRQADKDGHSWPPVVLNKSTVFLFTIQIFFIYLMLFVSFHWGHIWLCTCIHILCKDWARQACKEDIWENWHLRLTDPQIVFFYSTSHPGDNLEMAGFCPKHN